MKFEGGKNSVSESRIFTVEPLLGYVLQNNDGGSLNSQREYPFLPQNRGKYQN